MYSVSPLDSRFFEVSDMLCIMHSPNYSVVIHIPCYCLSLSKETRLICARPDGCICAFLLSS